MPSLVDSSLLLVPDPYSPPNRDRSKGPSVVLDLVLLVFKQFSAPPSSQGSPANLRGSIPASSLLFNPCVYGPTRPADSDLANPKKCHCTCWDTLFKGPYENGGRPRYKHVYFNLNRASAVLWALTVLGVIALYEVSKYLFNLVSQKKCRRLFLLMAIASLFTDMYTWWIYFNYINDGFYSQMTHQFIFSMTEVLSTAALLFLCNQDTEIQINSVLVIFFVAIFHIICASSDQFITNVIMQRGFLHQSTRDVALMLGDLLNLAISVKVLRQCIRDSQETHATSSKRKILILVSMAVACSLIVTYL